MIFPWQKWKKLAYRDDLTGVYNRRYLLSGEWAKRRYGFIYFIDIDGLHEVNKRGFIEGDRLIKYVVDRIRDYTSDSVIFRIGGDEFVVLSNNAFLEELSNKIDATVAGSSLNTWRAGVPIMLIINDLSLECTRKKNEKSKNRDVYQHASV